MAYTMKNFIEHLAIFSAGGILGPRRMNKMIAYAGRKGIQLAGFGGARAAIPALPLIPGAVQAATPYAVGLGLGAAALGTPGGQELLAAAEEHGRQSRVLYERYKQELLTTPQQIEAAFMSQPVSPATVVPAIRKRATTKFNQAIKKGMAIVKASSSYGRKGTINNPKKAFGAVVKIVAKAKAGKRKPKGNTALRKVFTMAAKLTKPRRKVGGSYVKSLKERLRLRK